MTRFTWTFAFVVVSLLPSFSHGDPPWPAPKLTDDNYRQWIDFVQPDKNEMKWRNIRWHKSLSIAAKEAAKLQRPILLWTMNGHPCGET